MLSKLIEARLLEEVGEDVEGMTAGRLRWDVGSYTYFWSMALESSDDDDFEDDDPLEFSEDAD